jgi:hypothetical protein
MVQAPFSSSQDRCINSAERNNLKKCGESIHLSKTSTLIFNKFEQMVKLLLGG